MDEILYELRNHSAGLNCGRWDYIFSFIKKFSADEALLFPGPLADHHDLTLHACLLPLASPSRPAHRRNRPQPSAA